jgi:hypothetical protein
MADTTDNAPECYLCEGQHYARDCEFAKEIKDYGRKLREKKEKARRSK